MKARRHVLWVFSAIGLLLAAASLFWPAREPQYHGKKLSAWLIAGYGSGHWVDIAREPLQHIGTNALPFLIEWTKYRPSILKAKCYSLLDGLPGGLRQNRFVKSLRTDKAMIRSLAAANSFYLLGSKATPAIPHLCWMMTPSSNAITQNFWPAAG